MSTEKTLAHRIGRIVALPIRYIVFPIARFIHLRVAWIAQDDEMILSLCLIVLLQSLSLLIELFMR